MLIRALLIGAVVFAAITMVRKLRERGSRTDRPAISDRTVQCEHCEVYLPQTDAVVRDGHVFCSDAHAREAGR